LSDSERQQLLTTLKLWVDLHVQPDEPVISVAHAGQFSPRQIYNEVLEESEFGKFFVRMVEHGASVAGFDQVLAGFAQPLQYGP
jgi:hypothetical protein